MGGGDKVRNSAKLAPNPGSIFPPTDAKEKCNFSPHTSLSPPKVKGKASESVHCIASQLWMQRGMSTALLEKFWWISLYVTDDVIAKLYVT